MNTGLFTKRGAIISIHFGKICTTNLWDGCWYEITNLSAIEKLKSIQTDDNKLQAFRDSIDKPYIRKSPAGYTTDTKVEVGAPAPAMPEQPVAKAIKIEEPKYVAAQYSLVTQKVMDFFSEFKFTPAARFLNTLARVNTSPENARDYIKGYMALVNNPDQKAITEKMKSAEFANILIDLAPLKPTKQINSRLCLFYGDAGTGKTTLAIEQNPDAAVITCNASILPDELMRTFDFNDENGHPVFKKSSLRLAMEEGKPIIFDEINLLNFDSLRLLQTFLDSKDHFDYNGETVEIKDGFKIIGTMNLFVNDQCYNLPEPLVDRAFEIKEFKLSAEQLASYAF